MAILKDLIVQGPSRFIGEAKGTKFVTDGGTSSLFVKGDGTLDSTTYTPQTSAGANALLTALPDWTAVPTDTTKLIRRDTGNNASFGQGTFLTIWTYIKGKISSVLGIGGDNGVPTAPTAASGTNTTLIATTAFVSTAVSSKQNTISDLATIRSGASAGATAYQKPSGGIPKTDLASAVLTSLGKADTALQSESDPVFSASAAAGITSSDITNWNGKTSNTGTITSVVTTAGAHTTINKTSGSAAFNVPTKTSHLTNDSGFLTAHLSIKTVNGNTLVGTGNVTIPTPNDATLTIKRDGMSLGTFTADSSENKNIELRVLQSKTYTGVIGTANTAEGATFYFMSVLPEDRVKPCTIKYRIYASMEGLTDGIEESIVTMTFSKNAVLSYDVWNYVANTSYRPYYYHYRYLSTLAGYNSGYGHLVGVGMRYSYNPATAANARTYIIDILDVRGGTVTFFDTMLKFANVPGTGSTNYSGESTYDATTNGETHLGDRNDVNYQNRELYGCRKTNSALYRYMLCLTKSDSSLVPLNSVSNSVATNKTLTTDSFDPFGEILFWNTTTTYAAGANVGDGWYRLYLCDLRYSFNCGGYNTTSTLVGRLPLYLVAVPQSDGTAVLHSAPLSLTLPLTEDGLIYIYLGTMYPDNYPYRLNLALVHPIYYYKDLAIRLWTGRSYVAAETDPVFSASPAADITSADITSWNGKQDPATTLAGYGITDAKIQNGVITLGSNTITPLTSHLSLSNYVTLNGAQSITGEKTFTGNKRIKFKLSTSSDRLGFTLYNSSNVEVGFFEWEASGINAKSALTLGLWVSTDTPATPGYLGFKVVDVTTAARYALVTPLLADAKTPLSLNNALKLFYFPLLFKNGTNTVTTANTGVVDLSTLMLAYELASNKVTSIDSSSTDTLYPSAKCVYDAINNINPRIPITNHGTSDTTFALTPNIYHKWGSVSLLTLTLATPDDVSVMNEYIFSFTSPATPTTLSVPASVNWVTSLDILANKEYRISIIDNLATWITSDMVVPIGDVNTPEFATKAYVDAGLALKEDSSNKVTSVDENSTDTQYPSAKAMYDALNPS